MNTDKNNHIDWDKLLDHLDGDKNAAPLNEAELAELAAAREMKARMGMEKFSVEDGWQQFVQARGEKKIRTIRLIKLAAAALLIPVIGTSLWWMLKPAPQQQAQIADQRSAGQVRLKLAGGRTISIGKDSQLIQSNAVAKIQAGPSSLIYAAGNNSHTVTAMDTLEVPRGLQFTLHLSDGTQVWLNAGSTLIYPAAFNGTTREVFMQGEAFFEVAQHAHQPFIVHSGKTAMKVLGTAFNVNAYGPDITTTLSSGRLLVTAGQQQTVLAPGEQTRYDNQNGALTKKAVDPGTFTSWKEGDLFYEEVTLLDITTSLGRYYDYNFVFENKKLEKLSFTLDIRRPAALQDVLNLISRSMNNICFRVENRTVYVTQCQ